MGVAAYNRGSKVQERQLHANRRPVEFEYMDDMNSLPKYDNAKAPLSDVKLAAGHGGFWVYCPTTGFGFWYRTLPEAVRSWNIALVGFDGEWTATPVPNN